MRKPTRCDSEQLT